MGGSPLDPIPDLVPMDLPDNEPCIHRGFSRDAGEVSQPAWVGGPVYRVDRPL